MSEPAAVLVGTAGFKYDDWKGPFYPAEVKDPDLLRYYATQFPAVELDFTYYAMPGLRTMQGIEAKTPPGFQLCVKANRGMTHEPPAAADEGRAVFAAFAGAMQPVIEAGKLGCVLAQFPWSFKPCPESRDYVRRVRDWLPDLPVVVEFRNSQWLEESTFELLAQNHLGFCCVDEPRLRGLMPPVSRATAPPAYVRFHGRNAAKWWQHEQAWERYAYLYSEEELQGWVDKILGLAGSAPKTFAMFNNHYAGNAPRNARMLRELLEAARPGCAAGSAVGWGAGQGPEPAP